MAGRLALRGVVVSQRDTTHQRTAEYPQPSFLTCGLMSLSRAEFCFRIDMSLLLCSIGHTPCTHAESFWYW